jgi:hypothetical protein
MAHKKMLKTYWMKKPPYFSQLLQVVKYAHKRKINYWYQGKYDHECLVLSIRPSIKNPNTILIWYWPNKLKFDMGGIMV